MTNRRGSPALGAVAVVATLYFARDLLVPIALAVLLSFLLAPVVHRLQQLGLSRVIAVLLVTFLTFGLSVGLGVLITKQVLFLAAELPRFEANLIAKIRDLRPSGENTFTRAGETLKELQLELSQLASDPPAEAERHTGEAASTSEVMPAPVRVVEPPAGPWSLLQSVATPVLRPLGITAVVTVLVIFFLIRWRDLRDRMLRLVGIKQLSLSTHALTEAGAGVSRYLLMQFLINGSYGVAVAIGLFAIGIPSAVLWGALATALRFIPYVGPWMAAGLPILTSIAVSEGWTAPFIVVGMFVVLELITNNIVEPWLYGAGTGVSTVAILLGTLFWTWLWGGIGLLLATPLTVCLVVIGRHVPQLEFLSIVLGDDPALDPPAQLYQRLLAFDLDGASDLIDECRKIRTMAQLYNDLMLPALIMAEKDRYADKLTADQQAFVYESMHTLIGQLAARDEALKDARHAGGDTDGTGSPGVILCIPVLSEGDELAARMLAHLARVDGANAHVIPAGSTTAQKLAAVTERRPDVTVLSALPPSVLVKTASLCNQVASEVDPGALVVGLWNGRTQTAKLQQRLDPDARAELATSLPEALAILRDAVVTDEHPMQAPAIPENESERICSLEALGLLDTASEEAFDRYTKMLARIFGVPIALISLVDRDRQWWKSHVGLPAELATARGTPRALSVCGHVVALNEALVVPDLLRDKRFANNPLVRGTGIRFYAGVPLRSECGLPIGSLCIIDTKPRRFDQHDRATLQAIAEAVMSEAQQRRGDANPTPEFSTVAPPAAA